MADLAKSILRKLHEAGPTRMDYTKATDEELVELIQKNKDSKAEDTLIRRYDKLIAHISKDFFLKGGGDQDDLKQEGLIGVASAIKDFVPGKNKNFKQFALLAAKRNITDAVRKSTSGKASFLNNAENIDQLDQGGTPSGSTHKIAQDYMRSGRKSDPYEMAAAKHSKKQIQDYMNKNLTDWEKSVLSYYLQGYSYNEIASKVGRNRKAVDNAMNSVRSKMRVYKDKFRDSKAIRIIEFILSGDTDMKRMNEALAYLFEEDEVEETPTAQYKKYLKKHREGVMKFYETLLKPALLSNGDADEKTLAKIESLIKNHDASKNSAAEFSAYRNYFYDKEKYSRSSDEFNAAWNHHQKNNPHHWQYWILVNDVDDPQFQPQDMPLCYVIEMLADWHSAGNHYGNTAYDWYQKQKDRMLLSDNTRTLVEKYIEYLK